GQDPKKDVGEFGVYSQDHELMIVYLKDHGITTVAMESTGSYWQSLFLALQKAGFEVLLVSGHQTKNVRAKTDVKDCIWIQKLHSLGLLRGCFLPDNESARLRTLQRHRSSLIEESSKMVNKIQKAMRMMNLRLDVVISDVTGKTGTAIIRAIIDGERDGQVLSKLADPRIKKSREEVALALKGNWDEEL
ncbi:transposase, partial [Algoriphagus sp. D3-2-R+10]|uniref:IS110 family transposase n=1 Tax=Algoriphagus aurantiacus TaxID=3103948 RepID=UPI002B3D4FE0